MVNFLLLAYVSGLLFTAFFISIFLFIFSFLFYFVIKLSLEPSFWVQAEGFIRIFGIFFEVILLIIILLLDLFLILLSLAGIFQILIYFFTALTTNVNILSTYESNFKQLNSFLFIFLTMLLFIFYLAISGKTFPNIHQHGSSELVLQVDLLYLPLYFRITGLSLCVFLITSFIAIFQNLADPHTNFPIAPNLFIFIRIILIFLTCIVFVISLFIIGYREKIVLTSDQLIHSRYYLFVRFYSSTYPRDLFTVTYLNKNLLLVSSSPSTQFDPNSTYSNNLNSISFKLKEFTKLEKDEIRALVTPLENFRVKIADNLKKFLEPDNTKPGEEKFIIQDQ